MRCLPCPLRHLWSFHTVLLRDIWSYLVLLDYFLEHVMLKSQIIPKCLYIYVFFCQISHLEQMLTYNLPLLFGSKVGSLNYYLFIHLFSWYTGEIIFLYWENKHLRWFTPFMVFLCILHATTAVNVFKENLKPIFSTFRQICYTALVMFTLFTANTRLIAGLALCLISFPPCCP